MRRFHYNNYGSVWVLLAAVLICSAATWSPEIGPSVMDKLALNPAAVRDGELWRLVTYALINRGTWFFIIALMFLYYIAAPLEAVWGTKRFLTLVAVSIIGGGITATLLNRYLVGGSGFLITIMLIHGFLFPESEVLFMFFLPMRVKVLAMISAAIYFFYCAGQGLSGLALFAGTFCGVLYYMMITRSIPWIRRARRKVIETASHPLSAVRSLGGERLLESAKDIIKRHRAGEPLTEDDQRVIEQLIHASDPSHELCSPYSFSLDNTICPPCKALGRCLRRYLESAEK